MALAKPSQYVFSALTATGSTFSVESAHGIVGQILKVEWQSDVATGSLFLQASGTGEVFLYKANPSGTVPFTLYPVMERSNISGTLLANGADVTADRCPGVLAGEPLVLCGSGFVSGGQPYTYLKVTYI